MQTFSITIEKRQHFWTQVKTEKAYENESCEL